MKLLSAHHALHPQSDVDRLYLPRQAGGRGLLQIRQTVAEKKRALNDYIKNNTEHALKAVSGEELLKVNESKSEYHKKERIAKNCGRANLSMVSILRTSKIKLIITSHGVG